MHNVQIDCFNYEDTTTTGKRYATAIYAGQDVPVRMYNVTIHVKSQSNAYGVQSEGEITLDNGSIVVETTRKATAYGVYAKAAAVADTAKCYASSLRMKEAEIVVSSAQNTAYGVYAIGKSVKLDTVINGSDVIRMGAGLYIENSRITVSAAGKTAQGVIGGVGYNSFRGGEVADTIRHTEIIVSADSTATAMTMGMAKDKKIGAMMSSPLWLDNVKLSASAVVSTATALAVSEVDMPVVMRNTNLEAEAMSTAYGIHGSGTLTFEEGSVYVSAGGGTATYGIHIAAGGVDLRDARLSSINHEGTPTGKRSATGVYAGQDVAVNMRDVQIDTKAETSVYGVQTGGELTIDNGNISAVSTVGSTVYGIYLKAAADTAISKCYAAGLRMKDSEVTVSSAQNNAYGVYAISKGVVSQKEDSMVLRMGASVHIEGGRITASAADKTAQTITLAGGYNALEEAEYRDTVRHVMLSAKASSTATAIAIGASADKKTGIIMASTVWLDHVIAEATATEKSAVALSLRGAEVVVSDLHYAAGAAAVIEGGTYMATALSDAYALSATVSGLTQHTEEAYPRLTINNARLEGQAKSNARALSLTAQTAINGCTLKAQADSINAYVDYLTNSSFRADSSRFVAQTDNKAAAVWSTNAKTQIRYSTLQSTATSVTAYGLYVTTSISDSLLLPQATLISADNHLSVSAQKGATAYGYYLAGSKKKINDKTYVSNSETSITGGTCQVSAADKVYCVFLSAPIEGTDSTVAARCRIDDGEFEAIAFDDAAATVSSVNDKALAGDLTIYGGYFSHSTNLHPYLASGKYVAHTSLIKDAQSSLPYMVIDGSDARYGACRIDSTIFKTLEEALLYAAEKQQSCTIVMLTDYTLPQGEYVVPRKTVLLIPANMDQEYGSGINVERTSVRKQATYPYLRLTLADGVRLRCEGRIETGGMQHTSYSPRGSVYTPYGVLEVSAGARLEIANGASLICWGFVTGEGEVDVFSGGVTYEHFQMGDWKGGTVTADLYEKKEKIFPVNQFFVQNIETQTTYHIGARALGTTCVSASGGNLYSSYVNVVGQDEALFSLHKSVQAKVVRHYDTASDRMTWMLYDASVAGFYIDFGEAQLNSRRYVLPIPNNYTIVAASDTVSIMQDVFFTPSAQLRVMPNATFLVPASTNMYLYAADDWGAFSSKLFSYSLYSPSWETNPRDSELTDAEMYVGGMVVVRGNLHTTPAIARVYSDDEGQGQILFEAKAVPESQVYQVVGTTASYQKQAVSTQPVLLTNADGTLVATAESQIGTLWQYKDGVWTQILTDLDDMEADSNRYPSRYHNVRKQFIRGNIYIVNGKEMFTVLGDRVD